MNDKTELVIQFLEKHLIEESNRLIQNQLYPSLHTHIAQGIELMGAFLDAKPLRAREQSRIRFEAAVRFFFPPAYQPLLVNGWFYQHFRNHVVHTFLPGSYFIISHKHQSPREIHLSRQGKKILLISEDFQADYRNAVQLLIENLKTGQIKAKLMEGLA